jgi:alpha-1,3-rhamnosyl/mannosyltransferase
MRVAVDVSSALKPGGTGIAAYVRELVPALAAIDAASQFYLVWRLSRIRHRSLVSLPGPNFARRLLVGERLCRLPDDVAVFHACGTRLPRLRKDGMKLIPTFHDILAFVSPDYSSAGYRAKKTERVLDSIARAWRILTDSQFSKDEIVKHLGVPKEMVVSIPLGVDRRFHPGAAAGADAVRAELGIGARPYILFVGLLTERKNVAGLLEAFERALPALPRDLVLVLAGRPKWGQEKVLAACDRPALRDRVVRPGFVPAASLPALYAGAHVFVQPSFYEGFGLPVLEAMASGTPVLSSNAASLPEVAGDAARLVDPRDIPGMADGLVAVATDGALREAQRARGLARAAEFSWERTARLTHALYREAAGMTHAAVQAEVAAKAHHLR